MATKSVLIVNMGSSSLKWVVLDAASEQVRLEGDAHWDAAESGRHEREVAAALEQVHAVDAVGHRVVHGGLRFREAVLVDDGVRAAIDELSELAPLHNPSALAGINAATQRFPGVPQIATFDTACHAGMPEPVATYPLPWEWTTRWGLRRFGFHGLSVAYAASHAGKLLGYLPRRMVVCHLGAGCSVTALADGRSVNTSMGFTPLEGVMMTQRSGSVDPGLLLYLLLRKQLAPAEVDNALNHGSGLLGVSGVSADMREVLRAAAAGEHRAILARDMFVDRVVSCVGGMVATLRGLDALVFTGGIGEHSGQIREAVCEAFGYLGVRLDPSANTADVADDDVALPDSTVRVLVITAREDLAILREVRRVLAWT